MKEKPNSSIRNQAYKIKHLANLRYHIWNLYKVCVPIRKKRALLVVQWKRICLATQKTWVWYLGQEDPLEKEMITHSNILAWKSPVQRSLVGFSPWCHKRVWHALAAKQQEQGKKKGYQWGNDIMLSTNIN